MVPIVCIILTVLIPRMSLTSRFSLHQLSSSALTAWKYSSKYCTYIHCPLRLNTDHFNVPLLYLTIVWIAIDIGADFHGPQRMFHPDIPYTLTFLHQQVFT